MEGCPPVLFPKLMSLHSPTSPQFPPLPHREGPSWRKAAAAVGARWRSLAAASSTALVVASVAAPGLVGAAALGGLAPPAQAHAQRCITIKATALTAVTMATLLDPHLHCLRIEDNILLNTLDLDGLSRLTHLVIKNNNGLETINLTKMTHLIHVQIDNNDNLETIKLSESHSLRYLSVTNNRNLKIMKEGDCNCPERDTFKIATMTCLTVENNDSLTEIHFSELKSLTCLSIDNNKCLERVKLPALVNAERLHITNNEKLKMIELPESINFGNLNIENNQSLGKIRSP